MFQICRHYSHRQPHLLPKQYHPPPQAMPHRFSLWNDCNYCNTLHIRCPKCKSVTCIQNSKENIECEGGCGLTFFNEVNYDHHFDGGFTLKLIDHRKVKCPSCGDLFVDHQNIGVCEKCDLKLNLE